MIKVKLIADWDSSSNIIIDCNNRVCPNKNFKWKDIELVNSNNADFFVIYNRPNSKEFYNPKKTIIFQFELEAIRNTWGKFAKPNYSDFYFVYDIPRYKAMSCDWMLGVEYNDFFNQSRYSIKNNVISGIISGKYIYEGHKDRIDFLPEIDKNIPNYVHIGEGGKNLKSYSGNCVPSDRYKYFDTYKYTFAAENSYEKNYFTEKIVSPILCECLPFYSGCPNIEDFINPESYIKLDLKDPHGSIEIIKKAIIDDEWSKRILVIREQKLKLLTEEHPLEIISKIINNKI